MIGATAGAAALFYGALTDQSLSATQKFFYAPGGAALGVVAGGLAGGMTGAIAGGTGGVIVGSIVKNDTYAAVAGGITGALIGGGLKAHEGPLMAGITAAFGAATGAASAYAVSAARSPEK